jgi:hypothetical protein
MSSNQGRCAPRQVAACCAFPKLVFPRTLFASKIRRELYDGGRMNVVLSSLQARLPMAFPPRERTRV